MFKHRERERESRFLFNSIQKPTEHFTKATQEEGESKPFDLATWRPTSSLICVTWRDHDVTDFCWRQKDDLGGFDWKLEESVLNPFTGQISATFMRWNVQTRVKNKAPCVIFFVGCVVQIALRHVHTRNELSIIILSRDNWVYELREQKKWQPFTSLPGIGVMASKFRRSSQRELSRDQKCQKHVHKDAITAKDKMQRFIPGVDPKDELGLTSSFLPRVLTCFLGLIHTGRGMRHATQRKQMGPIVINGSVHTACKQHQRKNVPICVRVAWRVLCELGPKVQKNSVAMRSRLQKNSFS